MNADSHVVLYMDTVHQETTKFVEGNLLQDLIYKKLYMIFWYHDVSFHI